MRIFEGILEPPRLGLAAVGHPTPVSGPAGAAAGVVLTAVNGAGLMVKAPTPSRS